jgi:hypothetical protein
VTQTNIEDRLRTLEGMANNPKLMLLSRLAQVAMPILLTAILSVTGYAAVTFESVKETVVGIGVKLDDLTGEQHESNARIERLEDRLINAPGAVIVPLPAPPGIAPR